MDIGFTFGLAIYGMIWFVSLFMILPFGVKTQDEQGEVEPGSPGSAPHQASILKKMGYTTVLATILFLAVYWVLTTGALNWIPLEF